MGRIEQAIRNTDRYLVLLGVGSVLLYVATALLNCAYSADTYRQLYLWVVLTFCGLNLLYFLLWYRLRRYSPPAADVRFAVAMSLLFLAILLFAVPNLGGDPYSYLTSDVAVLRGRNPYTSTALELPLEPSTYLGGWVWMPALTGPARFLFSLPAVGLVNADLVASTFTNKLLGAAFFLGTLWVAWRLLGRMPQVPRAPALILLAWNPLILVNTMIEGGNFDIMMVFFALLALELGQQRRGSLAVASLALSAMVKYATIILLPLLIISLAWQRTGWRRWLALGGYSALASGVCALLFLPFWTGPEVLAPLLKFSVSYGTASLPTALIVLSNLVGIGLDNWQVQIMLWLILAAALLYQLRRISRRPGDLLILMQASAVAMLGFIFLARFWFLTKYLIWFLPFGLLADAGIQALAVFLTLFDPVHPAMPRTIFLYLLFPAIVFSAGYFLFKRRQQHL